MNTVAWRTFKLYAIFLNHLKVKVRYTYKDNCSKNRAGSFNQLGVPWSKVVHQYQDCEAGEHFYINILDKYLRKLPPNARDKDIFIFRPILSVPADDTSPWYVSVAIGKNPDSWMMKTTCEAAGIPGNKTNQLLMAYAALELFNTGIPKKIIQDHTGHR